MKMLHQITTNAKKKVLVAHLKCQNCFGWHLTSFPHVSGKKAAAGQCRAILYLDITIWPQVCDILISDENLPKL